MQMIFCAHIKDSVLPPPPPHTHWNSPSLYILLQEKIYFFFEAVATECYPHNEYLWRVLCRLVSQV